MTLETCRAKFLTNDRPSFVALFEALAKAIPTSFLHGKKIPRIEIKGGFDSGKSLAVEVMIKNWSDDHTVEDVRNEEKTHMFLERRPCDATETVKGIFNVAGKKSVFVYDSSEAANDFMSELEALISHEKSAAGGAVFYTSDPTYRWQNSCLKIGIYHQSLDETWKRKITINVSNTKLCSNTQFQQGWAELQKISESCSAPPPQDAQPKPAAL